MREFTTTAQGIFEFTNSSCLCVKDLVHNKLGKEEYQIKVMSSDKNIPFCHHFIDGIRLKNNHGDNAHSPKTSFPRTQEFSEVSNTLDNIGKKFEISALLNKDEITDLKFAEKVESYFSKYGFLFPIASEEYETFSPVIIGSFFDRLATLINLMNAVDELKPDYNKMFVYTFMLAMKQPSSFCNLTHSKNYLNECEHSLYKTYSEINFSSPQKHAYDIGQLYKFFPACDVDKMLMESYEEDKKTAEQFLNEIKECCEIEMIEYSNTDIDVMAQMENIPTYNQFYAIKDYFLGDDNFNFIRKYHFDDEDGEINSAGSPEYFIEKIIKYMYLNTDDTTRKVKLFCDFLYHYHFEISKITEINEQSLVPISLEKGLNLNKDSRFNDRFKNCLRELANYTIKEELDYMVSSVRPVYNAEEQSQGWYVKDLCTAIYYSIFLTDRKQTVFRKCAFPSCDKYFSVASTNDRMKYHDVSCQRAMAQRFNRARKKLDEANNEE